MTKDAVISCAALSLCVVAATQVFAEVQDETVVEGSDNSIKHAGHSSAGRYKIAQLDWEHVSIPYIVSLWILIGIAAKVTFNVSRRLANLLPDSSLLIIFGLIVGAVLYFIQTSQQIFQLQNAVFFKYLLPPIVFDAGYFMPTRPFFENLGTILIYAVLGTLWNTITIGLSLWAIGLRGLYAWPTPLLHVFVFTALISAVDPVAVLVVFEEVHVNAVLFIVVFGESLLNDAVTVVLYDMFDTFAKIGEANLLAVDVISAFVAFFVVSLGGVMIGIIFAGLGSLATRCTSHVRVVEPLLVFIVAYLSYLTADMFHLSAILAIVACGLCMKPYVEANISPKSKTTLRYFIKMMSSSCETIIFMFLGTSTVSNLHNWDTAFVTLTVFFCLIYRALGTVFLTYFVNKKRLLKLGGVDQFIMSYGGLRGAIAYGLVIALDESHFPGKQMFVTTTVVVIYFTVFLQGMTIKPLVNLLGVKLEEHKEPSMLAEVFESNIDRLVHGFESIVGFKGYNWRRAKFEVFNEKYVKPFLTGHTYHETRLMRKFTEINLKAAMEHVIQFGTFRDQGSLPFIQSTSMENTNRGAYTYPLSLESLDHTSGIHVDYDDDDDVEPKLPGRSSVTHSLRDRRMTMPVNGSIMTSLHPGYGLALSSMVQLVKVDLSQLESTVKILLAHRHERFYSGGHSNQDRSGAVFFISTHSDDQDDDEQDRFPRSVHHRARAHSLEDFRTSHV